MGACPVETAPTFCSCGVFSESPGMGLEVRNPR